MFRSSQDVSIYCFTQTLPLLPPIKFRLDLLVPLNCFYYWVCPKFFTLSACLCIAMCLSSCAQSWFSISRQILIFTRPHSPFIQGLNPPNIWILQSYVRQSIVYWCFTSWSGPKKSRSVQQWSFLDLKFPVICSSPSNGFTLFLSLLFWFLVLWNRFDSYHSHDPRSFRTEMVNHPCQVFIPRYWTLFQSTLTPRIKKLWDLFHDSFLRQPTFFKAKSTRRILNIPPHASSLQHIRWLWFTPLTVDHFM